MAKELDRETKSNHTLIVKATEDCINTPPSISLSRPEAVALQHRPTPPFNNHQRTTKPTTSVASQYVNIYERYKKSRSLDTPPRGENNSIPKSVDWHADGGSLSSSFLMPHFEKYTGELFYHNDNTLVRVLVHVQDINDNPPVFIQKIYTGGVTTSTVFGTQFLKLTVSHAVYV